MKKLRMTKVVALLTVLIFVLSSISMVAFAEEPAEGVIAQQEAVKAPAAEEAPVVAEPEVAPEQPAATQGEQPSASQPQEPQKPVYTVRFVNYDGELFYALQVQEGQRIALPIFTPMLDNHNFLYWKDILLEEGVEGIVVIPFDFQNIFASEDLTIIAVYEEVPQAVVPEAPVVEEAPSNNPSPAEPKHQEEEPLPETLEDGTTVIGKRDETLGGLPILIIEDDEEEIGDAEPVEEELDGEADQPEEVEEAEEAVEDEPEEEVVEDEPEQLVEEIEEEVEETDGEESIEEVIDGQIEEGALEVIEDDELPLVGPEEAPSMTVNVYSTHANCMELGDTIQLWAELINYDHSFDVTLQWQYFANGEWHNADGGSSLTYSFVAESAEMASYQWRLSVRKVEAPEAPTLAPHAPAVEQEIGG